MALRIAAVGDNCLDRFLAPRNTSLVGGNAVNVAVHLARLGADALYCGAVGDDAAGQRIVASLAENGVDTRFAVRRAGLPTAYTDIAVDSAGERRFLAEEFGACAGYVPAPECLEDLRRMDHVHIGWLDDGGALKRELRQAGVGVSQDLSVNAAPENLTSSDLSIVFISADAPDKSARAALRGLVDAGAAIAIATCGAQGSLAWDGRNEEQMGVVPAWIVDTTGAGDSFIAGFLFAHLNGAMLANSLAAGARLAAATCGHAGGFPQSFAPL
jgi:fructoselysine 6-kinase